MSGPEIRGWALARSLAETHTVTVAVDDPERANRDGVRLISNRRRELVREAYRHDAILAAGLAPYLLAALRHSRTVTVSDQYDPVWLETSVLRQRPSVARLLRAQVMMRDTQVRFADVIAVAGQAQRNLLLQELEEVGGPRAAHRPIVTVPFGVPEPPEAPQSASDSSSVPGDQGA